MQEKRDGLALVNKRKQMLTHMNFTRARDDLVLAVVISNIVGVVMIILDHFAPAVALAPLTTAGVIFGHALVVLGALQAAGFIAFWMWMRPLRPPFVMDFPSGYGAGRPLSVIFWLFVAAGYGAEIAKIFGLIQ